MKLSKTMKKVLAVVCAVAMVVSSLTFYNDTAVKAAAPEWSGVNFLGDGAGGGTYTNKYKFYCEDGRVSPVNIQRPGWATADSIYVTFPAAITTSSLGEGNYDLQGGGIAIHLDAFTAQETEFTVTDALGTYTCYVYYADGTAGEIVTPSTTQQETTTLPTDEQGRVIVDGESLGETHLQSSEKSDEQWDFYVGGAGGQKGKLYFSEATESSIVIDVEKSSNILWGIQVKSPLKQLTAGKDYEYKVDYTVEGEAGKLNTKEEKSNSVLTGNSYTAGPNVATGKFKASAQGAQILFEFSEVKDNTKITINSITYTENDNPTSPTTTTPATADDEGYYSTQSSVWTDTTPWSAFAGSDANAMKYKGTVEGTKITFDAKVSANNKQTWQLQAKIDGAAELLKLKAPDQKYNIKINYTTDKAGQFNFQINGQDNSVTLEEGTHEITIPYTSNVTAPTIVLGLDGIEADTNFNFTAEFEEDVAEPEPEEKGDVALSGYKWSLQTADTSGLEPSEYNGYGFKVENIPADAEQYNYGALLENIAVENGQTYTLTLKIQSTENKVVPIEFTNGAAINRNVTATPEGATFTYKFTAKADTVKIYMPLGKNADDGEISAPYTITVSDVQFDISEPDPTETATTLPADKEITINEPTFSYDKNENKKYYEVHWEEVEGAKNYTSYIDVEDEEHIATAYHNGWKFEKRDAKSVDHIAGEPGTTQKLIVVAYDEGGQLIARGIKEIQIPELTPEEAASAQLAAKFTSEDNYAKNKTAFVSSGNDAKNIVDGNLTSRWQASPAGEDHAVGQEYFGVNLGEVKTIGQVLISFEASFAAKFDVYVAGADEQYGDAPVASGTASAENLISEVNFEEVEAQYVKVVVTEFSVNANSYGTSVYEMAVFAKAELPKEPIEVTGATVQSQDGDTVTFTWGQSPEQIELGQVYNVYIDGVLQPDWTGIAPQSLTYKFETPGEHTIKITAVLNGKETEGQTLTVNIEDKGSTSETESETEPESNPQLQPLPTEGLTGVATYPAAEGLDTGWYTVGGYNVYEGTWSGTASAAIDPEDPDHIAVRHDTCSNWNNWGLQLQKVVTGLTPDATYNFTWDIYSSGIDGKYSYTGGDTKVLGAGERATETIEVKATAEGTATVTFDLTFTAVDTVLDFGNLKVTDEEGNVVYPTTVNPETPSETPDAGGVTTPQQSDKPSVGPETTTPKATPKPTTKKALKKTKVRKAYMKKGSKKVKITFKRVKGAKKYKVQFSTKKKFKKILVRKTVKKIKVTVTNKKFRNKKKLYVRVRAVGAKKWSKPKKVKIKKK